MRIKQMRQKKAYRFVFNTKTKFIEHNKANGSMCQQLPFYRFFYIKLIGHW